MLFHGVSRFKYFIPKRHQLSHLKGGQSVFHDVSRPVCRQVATKALGFETRIGALTLDDLPNCSGMPAAIPNRRRLFALLEMNMKIIKIAKPARPSRSLNQVLQ
jgi:hypothetical protein